MPSESQTHQECRRQLLKLIKSDGYFREKITLSSGKESDYYIDARRVTLSAAGAYLSARLILDAIGPQGQWAIDAVGGPTLGADPLVGAIAVLSHQAGRPLNTFIIRKTPKGHGRLQQIEGPPLRSGAKVVLIDDVATTGQAFLQSLDVLRAAKVDVVKAICLVDRQEGAKEALAAMGCPLVSLFDIHEIHPDAGR